MLEEILKEIAKATGGELYKINVPFPDSLDNIKSVKEVTLQEVIKTNKSVIDDCKDITPDTYIDFLEYYCNFVEFINALTKDDIKLLSDEEINELNKQITEINKIRRTIWNNVISKYNTFVEEVMKGDGLENMSKEELIKYIRDHQ